MENPTTIAIDLSKNVFEIAVEREGRICERKRLNRRGMIGLFSQCPPATVVMEACGSAHYWGRKIQGFGHSVKLLPPQHVKPHRIGNKTDRRDAEAIVKAQRDERVKPVPVKTVQQQTICSLHRVRFALMKTRTARLNTLRGLLRELGVTIPVGATRVLPAVSEALADAKASVPAALEPVLVSVMEEVGQLEERIDRIVTLLKKVGRELPLVERLETIPGVGLMNATAFSAMVGDFGRFGSGRKFAGFLGLTPKEHSSGERRWLGRISKAGDAYLRTLLIGGARSMLLAAHRTKTRHRLQEWALETERRRGRNRAAVAVANKLARIIWAVSTRGVPFRPMPIEVKAVQDAQNAPA